MDIFPGGLGWQWIASIGCKASQHKQVRFMAAGRWDLNHEGDEEH